MLKVDRRGSITKEEQKEVKCLRVVDEVAVERYGQLARKRKSSHQKLCTLTPRTECGQADQSEGFSW